MLLCDDDLGLGIPKALRAVGLKATSLYRLGLSGRPDTEWLARAGRLQLMVFSCNKKILKVPVERDTLIREKVGIVFLTNGQEYAHKTLRLVLTKWETLNLLWDTTDRPFARFLTSNGRLTDSYRDYYLFPH